MDVDVGLWDGALHALKEVFGIDGFRSGQEEIVKSVLSGRDTLAVMPTGGGKSLCYQLPGLVLPGLTIVISPLIALMKDQVDSLKARGVRAASLHSGMGPEERDAVCRELLGGGLKFLYVAPERVRNPWFMRLISGIGIGLLAVDEAHCISQWGHDFRPDYCRIGEFRSQIGSPVTVALTATAPPDVQRDIVAQLGLGEPYVAVLGFDRKNLLFGVREFRSDRQRMEYALEFVRRRIQQHPGFKRHLPGGGIIYASTIRQAETVAGYLREHGVKAGLYHAGLLAAVREAVQERFMNDEYHCLVATTAFGMGVDKPDIRYVLHMSASSSVEAYTQESGRAGRDGLPAECMLLYAPVDMKVQEHFIDSGSPDLAVYRSIVDVFAGDGGKPEIGTTKGVDEIVDGVERGRRGMVDTALRKLRSMGVVRMSQDGAVTWSAELKLGDLAVLVGDSAEQRDLAKKRLLALARYIHRGDNECRTGFILRYFGSKDKGRSGRCLHCDLCGAIYGALPDAGRFGEPFPPESTHYLVAKYLSAVARCMNAGRRETSRSIADILAGKSEGAWEISLPTFGMLDYMDCAEIMVLCGALHDAGLVDVLGDGAVVMTQSGLAALKSGGEGALPAVLRHYLSVRFPNAASGGPYRRNGGAGG